MTLFYAVILGLVQGFTEFLPISSSGHLVLLEKIFRIENNCLLFDIVLHLGTLLAVFLCYKKDILYLIKNPLSDFALKLYTATIPTLIIALLFNNFFENTFNGHALFISFFVTGIFLIIAEVISHKSYQYKPMTYKKALVVGLFQGIALIPGISRSGTTIASCMVQGVKRQESAKFSFLLSIPIILASAFCECLKLPSSSINLPFGTFVIGFIFAAFSGIISIKIMLKVIKKANYFYFSIYLFILSLLLFFNQFIFFWF